MIADTPTGDTSMRRRERSKNNEVEADDHRCAEYAQNGLYKTVKVTVTAAPVAANSAMEEVPEEPLDALIIELAEPDANEAIVDVDGAEIDELNESMEVEIDRRTRPTSSKTTPWGREILLQGFFYSAPL